MNKTILITGASGDIGSAITKTLADDGYDLILHYHEDIKNLESLVEYATHQKIKCHTVSCDFRNPTLVQRMFDSIASHTKELYGLVHVAGIEKVHQNPLNTSDWSDVLSVNLFAAIECAHHAIPLIKDEGVIINIASIAGVSGVAFTGDSMAYSVSKAALIKFSENLSAMVAPKIRVVSVSPGYTLTSMWDSFSEDQRKECLQDTMIKRFITSQEIAQFVRFLVNNTAATGQNFVLDGGLGVKSIK